MADEQDKVAPILVADSFKEVRNYLLEVLESLSPSEWERPTAARLWSLKDVALHLLGGDPSNLSRRRDSVFKGKPVSEYEGLVAFVNDSNEQWVRTSRRLSTRVICEHARPKQRDQGTQNPLGAQLCSVKRGTILNSVGSFLSFYP
jgi:uncharacterized damage-inducible protein DinB